MRDGDRLIIVKIGKEGKKINNKKKRWKRSERKSEGPSPIYSLVHSFTICEVIRLLIRIPGCIRMLGIPYNF